MGDLRRTYSSPPPLHRRWNLRALWDPGLTTAAPCLHSMIAATAPRGEMGRSSWATEHHPAAVVLVGRLPLLPRTAHRAYLREVISEAIAAPLLGRERPRRAGPEADLVDEFQASFAPRLPRGCEAIVLREPKVTSLGFPDLVVVAFHMATAHRWTAARRLVARRDLRLAHLIHTLGGATIEHLVGLAGRHVASALDRLAAADLVRYRRGAWFLQPLRDAFAIRHIFAFEAKMTLSDRVLQQAHGNRWFASSSYVLLPRLPRVVARVEDARASGVGVWIRGAREAFVAASESAQPLSYASWLFNDWVWRNSTCGDST